MSEGTSGAARQEVGEAKILPRSGHTAIHSRCAWAKRNTGPCPLLSEALPMETLLGAGAWSQHTDKTEPPAWWHQE